MKRIIASCIFLLGFTGCGIVDESESELNLVNWGNNNDRATLALVCAGTVYAQPRFDVIGFSAVSAKRYQSVADARADINELNRTMRAAHFDCARNGSMKINTEICGQINPRNFVNIGHNHSLNMLADFGNYQGNWRCSVEDWK